MTNLLIAKLKSLHNPRVLFFSHGFRNEGKIMSIDDEFLEFYDDKRDIRKFVKIADVSELEVQS